jgi:cytochrome c oxidase cbb3-type subunit 3
MPSFHGKIPPAQIWELAAYVRSMSSNVPSAANGSRGDEMSTTPAPDIQKPKPPKADGSATSTAPQ